jgi:multidrug efflux system outer membrane protein
MNRLARFAVVAPSLVALAACTLAPKYERPALPVAAAFPNPPASPDTAQVSWKALFLDPKLQATIELALNNNRDLRIAALDIARARAQYGIAEAGLFPDLNGTFSGTRAHITDKAAAAQGVPATSNSYTAGLGLSWQIDIFGKIRSLSRAAQEDFLAARENRNAVEIGLIGETATAWLTYAADADALRLAQQTENTARDTFDIATGQARIGTVSDLDLATFRTEYETARQAVAAAATRLDQDRDALTLLAGAPVGDDLLPQGLKAGMLADGLPVGLPSQVLLNRPDVLAAEHDLKAANADIGAARAAFFPTISLTGAAGSGSKALDGLFKAGTGTWSYGASAAESIFAGGANINGVRSARASRDIAVAQYERAIQSAFRDVSDALAVRARIDERLDAQTQATDAALTAFRLSQARYQAGTDSYVTLLTAERTLFTAQQNLITLQALRATNLAGLYQAIGGDESLR